MLRLNKFLAMCGICSRRNADELILNKKIKVNGKIIYELGTVVDEYKDKVEYNNQILKLKNKKVYIMLNKPSGYITTSKEQFDRPYILELIHEEERVFPVGRLDMDTEGLILLTNDGEFSNSLMHPSKKIDKVYEAKVVGNITEEKIKKLEKGVKIEEYVTAPAKVKLLKKDVLEITIHEGKNRQVKKMCRAVGLRVEKLKRVRIGNMELGNLKVGEYVKFTEKQIKELLK